MTNDEDELDRTRRQMKEAPPNALYVIPTGVMFFYQHLARQVGRHDLKMISVDFAESDLIGVSRPVILDHSAVVRYRGYSLRELIRAANLKAGYDPLPS